MFLFNRKKFYLSIGKIPKNLKINSFRFEKWDSKSLDKTSCHNSVMCFLEKDFYLKSNGVIAFHNTTPENDGGTKIGDIIEITFYSDKITSDQIIGFLQKNDITMSHISELDKPIKTLWQILKNK